MSRLVEGWLWRVRNLVAQGEVAMAVDELRNAALNASPAVLNDTILLAARLARANADARAGLATDDQSRVDRNRIALAALAIVDTLEKQLVGPAGPVPAPIRLIDAPTVAIGLHQIIGINNLRQIAWLEQGLEASRAVCRILTPSGLGTGFLIGSKTLMTNNHVIGSADIAQQTKIEFNFQLPFGTFRPPSTTARYALDPSTRFLTNSQLDYTIVAVHAGSGSEGTKVESWGQLTLNADADPLVGEHLVIVQHPNGGPKQIVLTANSVLQVKPPAVHYSTDTMPGSSGSPVFNDSWQVIAIHHAAGPALTTPDGAFRHSNEGILMSAIRSALGGRWPD